MGQELFGVPRGVEVLIRKASVDAAFRQLLLERRAKAAEAIDLTLQASEVVMLNSVSSDHLDQIIGKVEVPARHRAVFLGKVAALMLAAVGMQTLGCNCNNPPVTDGIRPDRPPEAVQSESPISRGIRRDRPKDEMKEEVQELKKKVEALKDAEMPPAANGDAKALTEMKKKGTITIAGVVAVDSVRVEEQDKTEQLDNGK